MTVYVWWFLLSSRGPLEWALCTLNKKRQEKFDFHKDELICGPFEEFQHSAANKKPMLNQKQQLDRKKINKLYTPALEWQVGLLRSLIHLTLTRGSKSTMVEEQMDIFELFDFIYVFL